MIAAAACTGLMTSDISGTPTKPMAPPKPPFDRPARMTGRQRGRVEPWVAEEIVHGGGMRGKTRCNRPKSLAMRPIVLKPAKTAFCSTRRASSMPQSNQHRRGIGRTSEDLI